MSDAATSGPRRVITGLRDGQSVFASVEPIGPPSRPGALQMVWGSDAPPTIGVAEPVRGPRIFPPAGGVRMFLSEISGTPAGEPPIAGRMHATDTVDFVIVLSGSVCLQEGDGEEVELLAGDCVVQTGTDHAWINRRPDPARLAFVILGIGESHAPTGAPEPR